MFLKLMIERYEAIRKKMEGIGSQKGFNDPDVLKYKQELDQIEVILLKMRYPQNEQNHE